MSDGGTARIRPWLPTLVAVFLSLTLAGAIRDLAPRWEPIRFLTFALFAAMFAFYVFGTRLGRAARLGVCVACGFICPVGIALLAIVGLSLPLPYEAFVVVEALLSGFGVGFQIEGDADLPVWISVLLWWLPIPLAIFALVVLRDRVRATAAR